MSEGAVFECNEDVKEMDGMLWQVLIMTAKGEAKNCVCVTKRSQRFPSVASQTGLTATRPENLLSASGIMQLREA